MQNLFTPQTPRAVFAAYIALSLFSYFCTISHAQNSPIGQNKPEIAQNTLIFNEISLQELPKYEESLRIYHNRKFAAERKEFIETTRKKWWYYLPNIGLVLGMPTVSSNTGIIAQIDRDRQTKKAKLEALQEKRKSRVPIPRRITPTTSQVPQTLLLNLKPSKNTKRLFDKKTAITSIYSEGFNAQKITPLEMLREDVAQQTARNQMRDNERRLIKLFFELEAFAYFNYPTDAELIKFVDMDCELINRPNPTTRLK